MLIYCLLIIDDEEDFCDTTSELINEQVSLIQFNFF
jgi:hypothetical protein